MGEDLYLSNFENLFPHTYDHILVMLEQGMDPDIIDEYGYGILHFADIPTIDIMLNHGADIDLYSGYYIMTPLYKAVESGNTKKAKYLLEKGAKFNKDDFPPLLCCILYRESPDTSMIKLLLEYELDPCEVYGNYGSPMSNAIERGYEDIVELFMKV